MVLLLPFHYKVDQHKYLYLSKSARIILLHIVNIQYFAFHNGHRQNSLVVNPIRETVARECNSQRDNWFHNPCLQRSHCEDRFNHSTIAQRFSPLIVQSANKYLYSLVTKDTHGNVLKTIELQRYRYLSIRQLISRNNYN